MFSICGAYLKCSFYSDQIFVTKIRMAVFFFFFFKYPFVSLPFGAGGVGSGAGGEDMGADLTTTEKQQNGTTCTNRRTQ